MVKLPMLKLNEIQAFIAVAEAQSVQEAANRLHLTQSAVSRLIQRLETDLGTVLFDRQTKPLSLTRDGQTALGHCRRILKSVGDFADAFTDDTTPQGVLCFGSSHVLARMLTGAPLDTLRQRFPALTLRLLSEWSGPIIELIRNGQLDGGVVVLPAGSSPPADLTTERLTVEEVRGVSTPALLARHGRTLAGMNEAGWVLQPEGCCYRDALTRALERENLSLNVLVEAYDQDLLLSLAGRGVGFTLAPTRLFHNPGTSLVSFEVERFAITIAVWLVRARQRGRMDRVFDVLTDELMQEIAPYHSAAE